MPQTSAGKDLKEVLKPIMAANFEGLNCFYAQIKSSERASETLIELRSLIRETLEPAHSAALLKYLIALDVNRNGVIAKNEWKSFFTEFEELLAQQEQGTSATRLGCVGDLFAFLKSEWGR